MSPTPFQGVLALEEGGGIEFPSRPPLVGVNPNEQDRNDDGRDTTPTPMVATPPLTPQSSVVRSRKNSTAIHGGLSTKREFTNKRHHKRRSNKQLLGSDPSTLSGSPSLGSSSKSIFNFRLLRLSTLTSCMGLAARLLFWSSAIAFVGAVGWYSYELQQLGYVAALSTSRIQ